MRLSILLLGLTAMAAPSPKLAVKRTALDVDRIDLASNGRRHFGDDAEIPVEPLANLSCRPCGRLRGLGKGRRGHRR